MTKTIIAMTRTYIHKTGLDIVAAGVFLTGCNKWDDHNAITDNAVTQNLFQQISADTSLSQFTNLLTKSGYDQVIASSKTFTVFAPVNAALATLDAGIVNDPVKLKLFVGNHITGQSWFTTGATAPVRIQMLNGKHNSMLNKTVEDATITVADKYAKNGVLQKINKMLPALNNCWETLEKNTTLPAAQKNYMLSLFRNVFDTTNAVQVGVDPNTGAPVYQPGTDSIFTNLFWRQVGDLRDENKQFTLFILTDTSWDKEVNKFKPFFMTSTTDSTTDLARWCVVKDLATNGAYTVATVPDTIVSVFNVKVPVTKTNIVQTIKTSNGYIYVMSKAEVQLKHKIQQFYIETENYRTTSIDKRGNTFFRDRYNPLTGKDYKDILVYNHGTALFNINYRLRDVYSTKYKAYWVAVNDFQAATFQQKVGIGTATATLLPYVNVVSNTYSEVYLGEFPITFFQPVLDVYLTAANSSGVAVSPLVCDYIRFEPVLQ
jgi:uncharacterized surface protein with fasciclin (FAS1) repeats